MKRAPILKAVQSAYYIPTIILLLFFVYVAALIILYNKKAEQIDRYYETGTRSESK